MTLPATPLAGTATNQIPIIDLSGYRAGDPERSRATVRELRSALENIGFFVITGHSVDWSIVSTAYDETRRFFAQPHDAKQKIALAADTSDGDRADLLERRGYIGLEGSSYGVAERGRNNVESLYLDYEETGRNQWPGNLPGFRERILAVLVMVDQLARSMLPLYARALDLRDDFFASFFKSPTVGFRLSHYPPASESDSASDWGIAPHTDRSFMTLLPTNDVAGLQVRPEGMGWIEAPTVPEAFVVNSGDILRRWSNDRFISTPHRVARPRQDRYAIPYFFGPDGDMMLETLLTCVNAERPPRYEPINIREFDLQFLRKTYKPNDQRLTT